MAPEFTKLAQDGLFLLGCGKMGSALLQGWLDAGIPPDAIFVKDPNPSDWLASTGVQINKALDRAPGVALIAVKPQMMSEALPDISSMANGATLFISIAAGVSLANYEAVLGDKTPIVRTMPNTPAAVGQGITAIVGNAQVTSDQLHLTKTLLSGVGQVVELDHEDQIDAVTGLSGSGPAYVFHMIECLAAAGEAQGLPAEMAMALAKVTVAGSGALAMQSEESPTQLRINVTSPNGTTQAGLDVLRDEATGLPPLINRTVAAATDRSKELKNG